MGTPTPIATREPTSVRSNARSLDACSARANRIAPTFEDDREVDRIQVGVAAQDDLFALPDGGWVAGARILAPDGTVRFDGHEYGQRFGMFGRAKAMAVSSDGAVAIVAGADSPSTCGRDCPPGSSRTPLTRPSDTVAPSPSG